MSYPERFLLQSPMRIGDGAGGYRIEWKDVCYLWGQISKTRVGGGEMSGESRHFSNHTIKLHDATGCGLSVGWRLISGEQNYEVLGIEDDGKSISQILVRSDNINVL